ncbi:MAG: GNAT family N-acetyltransferase [Clostridium sp.]
MANIIFRKLTFKDIDIFINFRINQLREEGATETLDLKPYLKSYYSDHLKDNTFISYLAIKDNEIIGTSGLSIVCKPPYFSNPTGKIGLISSMYTNPNFRRLGIAKNLLNKVILEGKTYGCNTIQITASTMGVPLYESYGFKKNSNFLEYKS